MTSFVPAHIVWPAAAARDDALVALAPGRAAALGRRVVEAIWTSPDCRWTNDAVAALLLGLGATRCCREGQ
jgi:hypothetical protein